MLEMLKPTMQRGALAVTQSRSGVEIEAFNTWNKEVPCSAAGSVSAVLCFQTYIVNSVV